MTKELHSNPLNSVKERLVFFLPGILGDEPKQAILRQKFPGFINFIVLELPDSSEYVVCSLAETGRVVAENIMRVQQKGDIFILGFSFGANLAVEVACHLTSVGRNIGYLGLIDGLLKTGDTRRSLRGLFDLLTAPRGGFIVLKNIVQIIKRRFFKKMKEYRINNATESLNIIDCRFTALSGWEPQVCEAQGIMLLSVFNFERSSLLWKKICPNCRQVRVRSDHHHFISGYSAYNVATVMSNDLANYLEKYD